MLGVLENYDPESFHNVIANIFELVLKDVPVLHPLSLYQLEPNILLVVDSCFQSQFSIPFIIKSVTFFPSPEVLCRYLFQIA